MLDYVVAMAKNSVLVRDAEPAMAVTRGQSEARGQTEHVYTDVQYAAARGRRWSSKPRSSSSPAARRRTTRASSSPICPPLHLRGARGDIENRIKELHDGLQN